jgi:hypothetical protein
MARRGGTSVSLDAPLEAVYRALRARGVPVPLASLTRSALRAWLAANGHPCPPEPEVTPLHEAATAARAARGQTRTGGRRKSTGDPEEIA